MLSTLTEKVKQTMEIQLLFSFAFMVIGVRLLPGLGLTNLAIETFTILILGNFLYVFMFIGILIHLYFDDRKGL